MTLSDALLSFLGQWGLLVGLVGFFCLFVIRSFWVAAQLELYALNAAYFCLKTKQPLTVRQEMAQMWPSDWILFELWRLDFRRYIVHHDHFDAMADFIIRELERPKLGLDEMGATHPTAKDEPLPPEDTKSAE